MSLPLERRGRTDDPAAAFLGDMPVGRERHLAIVPGWIDEDFHALGVEGIARERHIGLPADEAADPAGGRIDHTQAAGVAHAPHHALRIGRHELPMPVEERAVGSDDNDSVEEGRT